MESKNNLLGCFVCGPTLKWDDDRKKRAAASEKGNLFRTYIWGENGICSNFKNLNHSDYGKDLVLILFQFYLNPIPEEVASLKEIEAYRKHEKSVGIPIIVTDDNFFEKSDSERHLFLKSSVLGKLSLLDGVVQKKKLDTDMRKLKNDLENILGITQVITEKNLECDTLIEVTMKYQLVLQWPASTIEDYSAMITIENSLIQKLSPDMSKVDGHDFGSGQMNLFIFTDNPEHAFVEVQAVLKNYELGQSVRAAYRAVEGSEYKILWPINLAKFDVT